MSANQIQGTVTFIHHENDYVTLEYTANGKTKTINGLIGSAVQQKWIEEKITKKKQHFRIGDVVSFIIVPSARGDKMVADCLTILYNNALTNMLQKAAIDNKFVGYLKMVEDKYFVKETASYISFPLLLSPWEVTPPDSFLNEPVFFQLDNFDNPDKVTASLIKHQFTPAYNKALMHYNKQTPVTATVAAIKQFAVHVLVFGELEAKLKVGKDHPLTQSLKEGDKLQLEIDYLSPFKIVVSPV